MFASVKLQISCGLIPSKTLAGSDTVLTTSNSPEKPFPSSSVFLRGETPGIVVPFRD